MEADEEKRLNLVRLLTGTQETGREKNSSRKHSSTPPCSLRHLALF
jgi:hypothetical protein